MERLGQHFLANKTVLKRIADTINPQVGDVIMEVGPGHGELTDEIIRHGSWIMDHGSKLILIEKDAYLAQQLKEKYRNYKDVEIIVGDVRTVIQNSKLEIQNSKVVGNIPYYLTNFLLRILLELDHPPQEIIFTIQKEVAKRIVARPPHMNLLAISVQYFGTPELLFTIPKTDFIPPPKIDSATIKIVTHKNLPAGEERKSFFKLIKAGFSHPRKLLINNLSVHLPVPKQNLEYVFKEINIPSTTRAQEITITQWEKLSKFQP